MQFVVFITVPDEESGVKIARTLVENKLAACVNIIKGVRSIYFWEGKVQDDPELLLVVKTKEYLFDKLKQEVEKIHPYTVPEIIGFKISKSSEKYAKWWDDVTLKEGE
ncbi:divalent cation tolerance protein [Candidatus Kryptobacter tengchongensis]|nr:divalent cation tolerance protein [Candidatus Kryptobacter tengchongensis]